MGKPRAIPKDIRSELDEFVRLMYPELSNFHPTIRVTKYGYSAEVIFQNQSTNVDGSTTNIGTLSAVFEHRGQWHMTNDWKD
jgi:hypothetical protein